MKVTDMLVASRFRVKIAFLVSLRVLWTKSQYFSHKSYRFGWCVRKYLYINAVLLWSWSMIYFKGSKESLGHTQQLVSVGVYRAPKKIFLLHAPRLGKQLSHFSGPGPLPDFVSG